MDTINQMINIIGSLIKQISTLGQIKNEIHDEIDAIVESFTMTILDCIDANLIREEKVRYDTIMIHSQKDTYVSLKK